MRYKTKYSVEIELTPDDCARAFCEMDSGEMAEFFNVIADVVGAWTTPLCMQMEHVRRDAFITDGALGVMRTMGDYSVRPEGHRGESKGVAK